MRQQVVRAFDALWDMSKIGCNDPSAAVKYCRDSQDLFLSMSGLIHGRVPSNQWVRPSSSPTITTATTVVTGDPIPITFPRPGWIVGFSGTEAGDPANASRLSFDLSIDNGSFHLCSADGIGYTSLAAITQGDTLPRPYYPFEWYVTPASKWFLTWRTEDTVTAGTVLRPILMLAFEADAAPGAR